MYSPIMRTCYIEECVDETCLCFITGIGQSVAKDDRWAKFANKCSSHNSHLRLLFMSPPSRGYSLSLSVYMGIYVDAHI